MLNINNLRTIHAWRLMQLTSRVHQALKPARHWHQEEKEGVKPPIYLHAPIVAPQTGQAGTLNNIATKIFHAGRHTLHANPAPQCPLTADGFVPYGQKSRPPKITQFTHTC